METLTIEVLKWMMEAPEFHKITRNRTSKAAPLGYWRIGYKSGEYYVTTCWHPTLVDAINDARQTLAAFQRKEKGNLHV